RAAACPASSRHARRAASRPGTRSAAWCSSQAVQPEALDLVGGAADVGHLGPAHAGAGSGRVALVLRAALDQDQAAGGGIAGIVGARANAGMVVERRRLREAERALRDAFAGRDLLAQRLRGAAIALLEIDPGHQ